MAGLALARTPLRAWNYLFYGSFVDAALFFYGIVTEYDSHTEHRPR